mgnify:CR=1 FL=1
MDSTGTAPPRRLDDAVLNKSLEQLIRENKKPKPKPQAKPTPTPAKTGKPRAAPRSLKMDGVERTGTGAGVAKKAAPGRGRAALPVPRSSPGIRQPWQRPAPLPKAPLPPAPLKISIHNDRARAAPAPFTMDVDGDLRGHARARGDRDNVPERDEYRMGGRHAAQPMSIDYQFSRRRF